MQQFIHAPEQAQLPLFEAFLAQPILPGLKASEQARKISQPDLFSELSLRGAAGHCQSLLAPVLRELSEEDDARWLTLIAPPASLTQAWLRDAGLNRERILLLHPRGNQSPLQLTCEALRLGRSHTVVSWLGSVNASARQLLLRSASAGNAQSLNIRLG
ncbi:SOS-induced cell division inhibitor SulA [Pseudomonas sp. P1B16]|jgi:SOS-response cell division inhibitor, blocks FtsZ ring formation|uniref:SulA-like leucine-rich domain-containing protein n=2 Tax=Pseudomonas capeferrum TaxID=1495066 RepID=A0ABY7REA8_9PSED|nr:MULTISPECIES: SOS-induced cell division inhibitor SulA [Pseudomonas]KEY86619.1 CDP-glycerol--UDP-pyrophosphoryl-N-acetylglucosaminyl-N-acetylmannosamine glycerophosphotransferase [Pseudomonas capeferrum]KGI92370.1 CDP-glycerol--UDP-pyrophosphoryl-N-acetylglucosaminyl-N-acetylmannosamine glycerophosphotransferase [Pseudomonas sp. H2]MBC3479897.1 CDP-glycerol--UDP-pyrophosphoryl-N-acetylglucosaminyl-N-acetylmannosamine glycerophosphotransferase [Pseudomonas sp. SWRI77]MBC3502723.1 CDP-glycerol